MTSSMEKWPVVFNIVNVSTSVLGEPFNLYFVTGIMGKNQAASVKGVIPVLSETELEEDKVVLTTLINQGQLKHLYDTYEPGSKEWRGKYYAIANAIVVACQPYV